MNNWIINNKEFFQKRIVAVSPIKLDNKFDVIHYRDARSAAFYAMGVAIKRNSRVFLLVPGQYISNIYTAVTEAWFQKADITIVAFYDKISSVNTKWMDRCLQMNATYGSDENEEICKYLRKSDSIKGPILLSVVGYKIKEQLLDYSNIVKVIKNVDYSQIPIMCYNSCEETDFIKPINELHKYGIISKYVGMSIAKNQGYLLCNIECLLVDINVFRTRYANKNMKIIVIDDTKKMNGIESWIKSNNWLCKRVNEFDIESANWFISTDRQTVLIVG